MTAPAPKPCGCYSCGGQCGGNQNPGWCGPLADVAGKPICEVCRAAADVFADEDSNRLGARAAADSGRVVLEAAVFSARSHKLWMSPAMARVLAAVLLDRADQAEQIDQAEQTPEQREAVEHAIESLRRKLSGQP